MTSLNLLLWFTGIITLHQTRGDSDYLHMLMVFKRSEDRVSGMLGSFREEMAAELGEVRDLEKKIDDKLEDTISRVLGDGAREIGRDMGDQIAESARNALKGHEEFHFVRGQVAIVGLLLLFSVAAYRLGATYGFGSEGGGDFLDILLRFPAGNVVFVCGFAYTAFWCFDHWKLVREDIFCKVRFVLQILVLLMLLVYLIR
jgi:hypothetical protein